MKVAFVQYPWWDLIGVMYLSAVLKENGHKCEVFIGEKNLIKSLKKFSPDIAAFSVVTGPHFWDLRMAKIIKEELDIPIIFGGPHPTFFPQVIENENVDIICRGEGEYAMLELANKMEDGKDITKIKNLWVKQNGRIFKNDLRPLIENLDELPFPDREIYYKKYKFLRNYPMKVFLASRGCPYDCTFCFNHAMKKLYKGKGTYVRRRSVDNVIEEIKVVRKKYPLRTITFTDDIFILDTKWLDEFFKKYSDEVGIPYVCYIRADLINEKIVRGLKESGCWAVCWGIESGNEYLRNVILKKRVTQVQILRTARLLKKYGIKMSVYNILGLPGETLDNALETLLLNIKIKVDWPWCSIFQPYPGTELTEYAKKKGYLDEGFSIDSLKPVYFTKSMLNQENICELENLQKLFYFLVKFPSLIPFAKHLIKLPLGKFFEILFIFSYAYRWKELNRLDIKSLVARAIHPTLYWY
jgi:radical SAM superfamily enzyme YgiQ (UPF0313 family)